MSAAVRVRVAVLLIGALVPPSAVRASGPSDACSLITRAEIESVQGERVTDTKSSASDSSRLAVARCFYAVATFTKSVSLEVTRRDRASSTVDGPRDRWARMFHGGREDHEREPGHPPLRVPDVGDEAFWVGNSISGALYVLKSDSYIRLGIGGPEEVPGKIEKATLLARKALPRL